MYDPQFRWLELGTLSALWELQWLRLAQRTVPDVPLRFYNPCTYIPPPCKQMSYKTSFQPCELLCPATLRWTPYDERVRAVIEHAPTPLHEPGGAFAVIAPGVRPLELEEAKELEADLISVALAERAVEVQVAPFARHALEHPTVGPTILSFAEDEVLRPFLAVVGPENARFFRVDITSIIGTSEAEVDATVRTLEDRIARTHVPSPVRTWAPGPAFPFAGPRGGDATADMIALMAALSGGQGFGGMDEAALLRALQDAVSDSDDDEDERVERQAARRRRESDSSDST